MVAYKAENLKQFTTALFVGDEFDGFLLYEARIATYNTFIIDGKNNTEYYTEEDIEKNKIEDFASWIKMKSMCYDLIKGRKLPINFKIILKLNMNLSKKLILECNLNTPETSTVGFMLNIKYDNGELNCISACAINTFSLDKSIDKVWDTYIENFFKEKKIPVIGV